MMWRLKQGCRLVEKEGASIKEDAILRLIEYVDRDMVRMKMKLGNLPTLLARVTPSLLMRWILVQRFRW